MESKRKMDFKKYTSPPASKWYLVRIAFYIILLTGLIVLFFYQKNKQETNPEKIDAIENVNITIEK